MVTVGPRILTHLPGVPCSTSSAAIIKQTLRSRVAHLRNSETTGAVVPQGQTLFAIVCHVCKITKKWAACLSNDSHIKLRRLQFKWQLCKHTNTQRRIKYTCLRHQSGSGSACTRVVLNAAWLATLNMQKAVEAPLGSEGSHRHFQKFGPSLSPPPPQRLISF